MATTTTNSAKTYTQIAWTSLASAASSITFSSIPSTYTDLRVVFAGTSASLTPSVKLQFNSDTTGNYSYRYLSGNGTGASSSSSQNSGSIFLALVTGLSTTISTMLTIDIFSYAGSAYKTVLSSGAFDLNGSGTVESFVGLWRSTSAINTVSLTGTNANFAAGTTAALYGIKAA